MGNNATEDTMTGSLIRFVYDPEFTRLLIRGQLVFQRLIAALRARNRR